MDELILSRQSRKLVYVLKSLLLSLGVGLIASAIGAEQEKPPRLAIMDSVETKLLPPTVRIQSHVMRAEFGAVDTISISIASAGFAIAGFDFTLAYDRGSFEVIGAIAGDFPDSCDWEYFMGRDSPKCPAPCPSGIFKIVALAQFMETDSLTSCLLPDSEAELVKLIIKRKSDSRGRGVPGKESEPLRFFWIDCGDNSVSSVSGNDLYLSKSVEDANGEQLPRGVLEIPGSFERFPNYTGPLSSCIDNRRTNSPEAILRLINGMIVTPAIEYVPAPDSSRDSL